jgi:site-specific DNA-cytosine methylase
MKDFFGYGRSRSSTDSNVLTRHFNPYVNCLHTQVGSARENMEVYVAEFETMDIEPIGWAMRGRNPENPSERGRSNGKYKQRIEMGSNISNTITSVQKDSLVAEPNVLTPKLTDFGKQVRKQYESGELDMSRHDMTELEPRTDGVSNTLTSVQKDNLVAEPMVYDDYNSKFPQDQNIIGTITTQIGNPAPRHGFKIVEEVSVHPNSHALEFKGQESIKQDAAPSLRATDYKAPHCVWEKSPSYRIRKLTPRECFRLMGVTEADIDKIQQSGVSQSQQYKMAGNSIVVDCLYHMFRKMFTETACESQQLSLF